MPTHAKKQSRPEDFPPSGHRTTVVEVARDPGDRSAPAPARETAREPLPMRPFSRPPMAVLCALDDGSEDSGEKWRIRQPQFVIGRSSGDCIIPHDNDISGIHAEVGYRWADGTYQWHLADLNSTNGTFLRVARAVLRSGKQLLIGSRRYEFRVGHVYTHGSPYPTSGLKSTHEYEPPASDVAQQSSARLVELTPEGAGRTMLLDERECFMGSDAAVCTLDVADDPFLSLKHAKFTTDGRGRLVVENCDSLNGVWVRIERASLDGNSEFLIGQQRFKIRFPPTR